MATIRITKENIKRKYVHLGRIYYVELLKRDDVRVTIMLTSKDLRSNERKEL